MPINKDDTEQANKQKNKCMVYTTIKRVKKLNLKDIAKRINFNLVVNE